MNAKSPLPNIITPFPEAEGDVADLARIALLGLSFAQPGLFLADEETHASAWRHWLNGPWLELEDSMSRAYEAAARQELEWVVAEDERLHEVLILSPEERARNRQLAALIAASMEGAKHQSHLKRFTAEINCGAIEGFAAMIFTLRAAHYHVGPVATKAAYLYYEWRASLVALGWPWSRLSWATFNRAVPASFFALAPSSTSPSLSLVGNG